MNRKLNITSIVLSILIGVTLILTAINPTAAYASAPAEKVTPPPTATATPTQMVTETPMPTATPVETVPTLSLLSNPTYIVPGGQVTIVYQIANFEKITGTPALRFYAPEGLAPVNPEEGKWDESAGTFDLSLITADGKLTWQADEAIAPPVMLTAELTEDEQAISKAEVQLDALTEFKVEPTGGEANGLNGKVQVIFPDGAVSETVMVKVTRPSEDSLPIPSLSGSPFEITAVSDSSKAEVSQFSKPVEIQIQYDEEDLSVGEEELRIFWYDPTDGQWKLPLSQRVDAANNVIIVETDHFTVFDMYNSGWQSSQMPTMDLFQHSAFTGAATFSMPIKVPAGPGGFQPSLKLSYNSQTVDSTTTESQASWVGMGWSLDAGGYIERNGFGTWETTDDSYNLTSNGMGGALWLGSDGNYHLEDENFAKITFDSIHDTWKIQDKQGTTYYFEEAVGYQRFGEGESCPGEHQTWRWLLTSVVNIYNQTTTYTYDIEGQGTTYGSCNYIVSLVNWVYPDTITYANGRYQIKFNRVNRTDYKTDWLTLYQSGTYKTFQRSRLDNIQVKQLDGNGNVLAIIRKYKFNYCDNASCNIFPAQVWSAGGLTSTLVSVEEFGLGGTNSLPAYTFSYDDDMHLTGAGNGYGGRIAFTYDSWVAEDGGNDTECNFGNSNCSWQAMPGSLVSGPGANGYITIAGNVYKGLGTSFQPGRWYMVEAIVKSSLSHANFSLGYDLNMGGNPPAYYFSEVNINNSSWQTVTSEPFYLPLNTNQIKVLMSASSGVKVDKFRIVPLPTYARVATRTLSTDEDSYTFEYDYQNPQMNTTANSDALSTSNPYSDAYTEFRGHEYVTVTDPYGKVTITHFGQNDWNKGQSLGVQVLNGAALWQVTATTPDHLQWTPTIVPEKKGAPATGIYYRWVRTTDESSTTYQADGVTEAGSMQTNYTYDDSLGTPYYGNQITKEQIGDGVTLVTHTDYVYNTSGGKWLVGLPARTWVTDGTDLLTESINFYDGETSYQTPPEIGKLTATRTLIDAALGQYSLVNYGRDSWGNVTSQTSYSDYWTASDTNPGGARTSYTTYDSIYHTYAVSTTDALGHTTSVDYSTVAVPGTAYTGYTLGVPVCETDPNGAVTIATYDSFGRFASLAKPNSIVTCSSNPTPTLTVSYQNSPFVVTLNQVVDATHTFSVTRYYDGLGRQYLTDTNGVLVNSTFDAYGRAVIQSAPHTSSETAYNTVTNYDALGRPDLVTAPDGTQTDYIYNGLETKVKDANLHETITVANILGQTLSVTPPTGPAVSFDYDALGNMETATRGGVTTNLTYDNAGRKLTMSDPDLGNWNYAYNALGSMMRQEDAKHQVTCLYYDDLGRLKGKTYLTNSAMCPSDPETGNYAVENIYDQGVYGIGRRHSVSDASGLTVWTYDIRGRMVAEAKEINNILIPATTYTYNLANLLFTMTYPDGEEVTFTYTDQILLDTMVGTNTYVFNTQYDSASRITSRELGNGLVQAYDYYSWNVQGGRLENLSTESLQNFTYQYDPVGNILSIADSVSSQTQTFDYDALGRLRHAGATGTAEQGGYATETYEYYETTGNLYNKAGVIYTYDSGHAHAVSSLSNGNSYVYDDNGNMTDRNVGDNSYHFDYDAENRLTAVSGDAIASFTYNGDGMRVISVMDGETIFFVGGHYEITNPGTGQTVTKYYLAGASRVAVRKGATLSYLLADHLGSSSLSTDSAGNRTSELRYKPWGETRFSFGTMPTKYTFTGQFSYTDDPSTEEVAEGFGLMYYGARWYDPSLNRFTQADTIVPGGAQGYDRYAYSNNNPIRFTDPSGHTACDEFDEDGNCIEVITKSDQLIEEIGGYGLTVREGFTIGELKLLLQASQDIVAYINQIAPGKGLAWMMFYFSGTTLSKGNFLGDLFGDSHHVEGNNVFFDPDFRMTVGDIVHELGHVFDNNFSRWSPLNFGSGKILSQSAVAGFGAADVFYSAMTGEDASGIRIWNGIGSMPPWTGSRSGHFNGGTSEYFAQTFSATIGGTGSPGNSGYQLQMLILTSIYLAGL